MLYVAVGNDFDVRKKYIDDLVGKMQNKRPDAEVVILDNESFSEKQCTSYFNSIGLFDEKSIIKLLGICDTKEYKDFIFSNLSLLKDSENGFVLSENKLTPTEIKKIERENISVFKCDITTKKSFDNLFSLGDLLLQKNKQKLLIEFYKHTDKGVSAEEIMGIMLWQVKSLVLSHTYTEKESGLKSFVYNKCSKSKWSHKESLDLYKKCINEYHQSRLGGLTLQERLELLIIEL